MAGATVFLVTLFLVASVQSRTLSNVLDLNDEFYTEVRELLRNRLNSKIPPRPQAVRNWPRRPLTLGQVSGVSVTPSGDPIIFHRGETIWDETSFNDTNHYQNEWRGPIQQPPVLLLDRVSGAVKGAWGAGRFYMPHGLTVDAADNIWITDVALHQVFKFPPSQEEPSLVLGSRFAPGNDDKHFCKPTSVAVASNGDFFVADGYCNHRILKYSPEGELLAIIGKGGLDLLHIPHSLTLLEDQDLLCVADRENRRVVFYPAGLRDSNYTAPQIPSIVVRGDGLGKVFGVANAGSGFVYAVTGPTKPGLHLPRGFTIDVARGEVVGSWEPTQGFESPHAIAVSPDGTEVYVSEIGPNRVWKFLLEESFSS